MHPNFDDTATAFQVKTDAELKRAYVLFKLIAKRPLVQLGMAMTQIALKIRLPVEGLIKSTVFDHFCGGITKEDCLPTVAKIHKKGVSSVLDYAVEGKAEDRQFDETVEKLLEVLHFAKEEHAIPFVVCKPTGLGRFALYEKRSAGEALNKAETAEWQRIENRYDTLCKKAHDLDVALMIDAEESWMQDAADDMALQMMRKYNTKKPIVFNTLQLYRHDRMDYLKQLHKTAVSENFKLGIKAVRGAYLEKENKRAEQLGYKSPICPSKQATDANFDAALAYIMEHGEEIALFAGTHNTESCHKLIRHMQAKHIKPSDPRIWFSQLYGMGDHITFNLATAGYNAAKYVPYGPVREVIPYLIRRAEENTSVAGQTTRELTLLQEEKKRRAANR